MTRAAKKIAVTIAAIGAMGALTLGVAACGDSADAVDTAPTATASAAVEAGTATQATTVAATQVPVTLGSPQEFSLGMSTTDIPAGKVTFVVKNSGAMTHEFVVLKTTTPGADLKVTNGTADETGNIGETGDMATGTTKNLTLTLKPGHYVVLCNLPGHYQGGMWKNVTVS